MKTYSLLSKDYEGIGQEDIINLLKVKGVDIIDSFQGNLLVRGEDQTLQTIVTQFPHWSLVPSQYLKTSKN